MNKKQFQILSRGETPTPFVVERNQSFVVRTFGYVDPKNPSGDAIVNPDDENKIVIKKVGELLDGTQVYTAENNAECGAMIEIVED